MTDYSENFQLWCSECVRISDKLTGLPVAFELNAPQRRVAEIMEKERREGRPIRILMLKARQWGGSTLVQAYIAWMQLVRHRSRSALVCAHNKDAAAVVRSTFSRIVDCYPERMREDYEAKEWKLQPYERTQNILYLPARDCKIAIATANKPDAMRSTSIHFAHLSEAAFWADGDEEAASAIIRTVSSTIPLSAESVMVIESTANGKDNYLYHEWQRAVKGESDKLPVFVPWFEIEMYSLQLSKSEEERLMRSLTPYERELALLGADAPHIAWYRRKSKEFRSREEMMAEFPSTPEEAFATSVRKAFAPDELPEIIAMPEEMEPKLVVVMPEVDNEPGRLALFAIDRGKMITLRSLMAENLDALMSRAETIARKSGAGICIANRIDSTGASHGRWCERRAIDARLRLMCDRDDNAVVEISDSLVGDMIDIHAQLLREHRICDTDEVMTEAYSEFARGKGKWMADVLLRLMGSYILHPYLSEERLKLSDFIK